MKDENRRLKASLARKGIKELTDFYDVKNVELIIQNQTLKGENRKLLQTAIQFELGFRRAISIKEWLIL